MLIMSWSVMKLFSQICVQTSALHVDVSFFVCKKNSDLKSSLKLF